MNRQLITINNTDESKGLLMKRLASLCQLSFYILCDVRLCCQGWIAAELTNMGNKNDF